MPKNKRKTEISVKFTDPREFAVSAVGVEGGRQRKALASSGVTVGRHEPS